MKGMPDNLSHPNPVVRRRILDILAGARVAGVDSVLVQALFDPVNEVGLRAAEVLEFRYPWLMLNAAKVHRLSTAGCRRDRFGAAWIRLRGAAAETVRNLAPNRSVPCARLERIPGLVPEVIEALADAGRADEAVKVAECTDVARRRDRERRQLLLALTYACNLNCPYCYVKGWKRRFANPMSLEAFRKLLKWCRAQGVDWIILGGGEPTVHPALGIFLQEMQKADIQASLTSNGLFGSELREHIRRPVVAEFICHVEQDTLLKAPEQMALLRRNLTSAIAAGVQVRIRYTLTARSDHRERTAILGAARDLGIHLVNYGFAFQSIDANNEFFTYDHHPGGSFNRTLSEFLDEAHGAGVALHLSKPFPLCCLTTPTLRRAAREGGLRTACTAYQRGYTKNLTINPDLTTLPCNAIRMPGPCVTSFKDFNEAGHWHQTILRRLYAHPWRARCARCALHYRGICQGACLAEHLATIQNRPAGPGPS
jgi:radical SAM protein with 4Fe4S-binding SPASM domain